MTESTLIKHQPPMLADTPGNPPSAPNPRAWLDGHQLDVRLRGARPRLLTLARLRGLADEDAEEVAQEALITAWRQRATLRDPDRFDAWVDGICRTLCLRRISARARQRWQVQPLSQLSPLVEDEAAGDGLLDAAERVPDPATLDLAEELCQADLQALLDRALAHLSAPTRAAIVLSYLDEIPQAEVASRLGVSLSALEARLHRARRELRQVLAGPLRAEAESFGLLAGQDEGEGWRESREWCMICGQHRMRGIFEPLPNGEVNLRMRCPACSPRLGNDIITSYGLIPLDGLRSFRPALTRMIGSPLVRALTSREECCPTCGGAVRKYVCRGLDDVYMPERYWIACDCPRCGRAASWLANASWGRPETLAWMTRHPRHVLLPDEQVTYQGFPALRVRLAALIGAAHLDVYVHPTTLTVLDCIEE